MEEEEALEMVLTIPCLVNKYSINYLINSAFFFFPNINLWRRFKVVEIGQIVITSMNIKE